MSTESEGDRFLIDPDARSFVREIGTFWIGVAVGLAPFFGEIPIPGFRPLLQIFPTDLKWILLAVAPFSMGFVAAAVKFQLDEKTDRAKLPRWLWTAVIASLVGVFTLLYLQRYVVRVEMDKGFWLAIIGSSRISTCGCPKEVSDEDCIDGIGTRSGMDTCWDRNERENIKLAFGFDYLFINLGVGVVVGVRMLQKKLARLEAKKRTEREKAQRARKASKPKNPTSAGLRRYAAEVEPAGSTTQQATIQGKPLVVTVEIDGRRELERKRTAGAFDVFLCHNSADKPAVKEIGKHLEERGILPWLDEWELPPGQPWQSLLEEQIGNIRSAAVFVGPTGVGPWQEQELYGFLREFVSRKSPVIPVLLPDAPEKPELPIFLKAMTWVDFRVQHPNPLDRLIWGITGKRPERLGE
jgi:TIR domain